jgi:hypothetical protein
MLKMKKILPVFVALLFLGAASTAFAQLNCQVASTPVSRDTDIGVTEPAGDLTFTCIQPASGTATFCHDDRRLHITYYECDELAGSRSRQHGTE